MLLIMVLNDLIVQKVTTRVKQGVKSILLKVYEFHELETPYCNLKNPVHMFDPKKL